MLEPNGVFIRVKMEYMITATRGPIVAPAFKKMPIQQRKGFLKAHKRSSWTPARAQTIPGQYRTCVTVDFIWRSHTSDEGMAEDR